MSIRRGNLLMMLIALSGTTGCIGTDIVPDPVLPSGIVISAERTSVFQNQTLQLEAVFTNALGEVEEVDFDWSSADDGIAQVNTDGLVTGISRGQVNMYASAGQVTSQGFSIVVVEDLEDVASIIILGSKTNLQIGETIQFSLEVRNDLGDPLAPNDVIWSSTAPTIVTVDQSGLAEGLVGGEASILATMDGITSQPYEITVGQLFREGTFQDADYHASGMARMEVNVDQLILTFSDDFDTDFLLETYVYLANGDPENGPAVKANGLSLGEITTDGAKMFNITNINSGVTLNTYNHVVIMCEPASLSIGFATFD